MTPQPAPVASPAMPGLADVTVVIVTFNSAHCLPALARGLAAVPHVIVVDNASGDDSVQQVAAWLPQARIIRNERNLGFGAANNRAIDAVSTPFALLLNPDCELDAADVQALLQVSAQWPDAAMVAPQLLRTSEAPELNYRWPLTHWSPRGPGAEGTCCVGFACGAALLLNLPVMRPVGFFDEAFFLYYEDDDLCTRLFEARLPIVLAPHVRVRHVSRGSVRGGSRWRSEFWRGFHHAQSKIRYTQKHKGEAAAAALRRKVMWQTLAVLPLRLLVPVPRHVGRLWGRWMGLLRYAR